jgi:two-component system LytT family response regulator
MKKITAIIIDDEQLAIETLSWQLKEFCPAIHLLNSFTNPIHAQQFLQNNEVDLCFLDIDMPEMNGFEFLQFWTKPPFDIIFTTAYSEFAIKAFKVAAFDYLLKPIDEEELLQTIHKYQNQQQGKRLQDQLSLLYQQLHTPSSFSDRIALSTQEGVYMIAVKNIIRLEADNNYTTVIIEDRSPIVLSKTLKEVESLLDPTIFLRVHQSHTIQLSKIEIYHRGRGGSLRMSNDDIVPVSKQKKEQLLDRL